MTETQKQRVKELRGEGNSYASIADALGISVNTVQSHCRRNNVARHLSAATQTVNSSALFCKHCGKELAQKTGVKARKFCSDKCCAAWWAAHPDRLNRKAFYVFTCVACGKDFSAYGNSRRKYCSHSCYVRHRFRKGAAL
jgi:endogenous inhibitor of DNA gyrase (YacG/DUF329 family)